MRSVPVLAAVIVGAAALIAGCGQQHTGSGAPGSGGAAPSPSGSPPAISVACRSASHATRASKLVITAADNGRSFCVIRGTNVVVFLMGTPGTGTAGSGTLECGAILEFRVTVTVVGLTG